MTLSYEDLQWGLSPTRELNTRVYDYSVDRVEVAGVVRAISYRSQKGGRWKTYRHAFSRRPKLVVPNAKGRALAAARPVPDAMLSIGWLVDLELEDGRRVHAPGYVVTTDNNGSAVWLAAVGTQPHLALEQLRRGPIVTARGIEK